MTNKQRLELRETEIRVRLGELAAIEEPTEENLSDIKTLQKELRENQTQLMAAQEAELKESEEEGDPAPSEDGEGRELRELQSEASLANYVNEAMYGEEVQGAEKELREATFGDGIPDPFKGMLRNPRSPMTLVPWEMLLSESELAAWHSRNDPQVLEMRARTPVAAAAVTEGNQNTIAGRVFARSVAGYLDIPMPTVMAGAAGYPHLATGTTFSMQAKGSEQAAVAGSFGGVELSPIRATGSYEWSIEDQYELMGLEESLREDLRMGMSNLMSEQVLNGDGTAPNVQGIRTAVSATPATDPASADTFATVVARWAGLVDGLNCYDINELKTLMSAGTYNHLITLRQGASPLDPMTVYNWLKMETAGVEVSSRFPAPASDISHSVVRKMMYPERFAVAPVWAGFAMINDPYSGAQSGLQRLTVHMLWNFRVLQTVAFAHLKVHD